MMSAAEEDSPTHNLHKEKQDGEKSEEGKGEHVEESKQEDSVGAWVSWGQSLLQSAKEKTLTTYDMVKKDLAEFTDVVENETKTLVTNTSTVISDKATTIGSYVAPPDKKNGSKSSEAPSASASEVALSESTEGDKPDGPTATDNVLASLEEVGSTMTEFGSGLMHGLITQVNKALYVRDTTQGESDLEVPIVAGGFPPQARQARLYAIQTDPGTYVNEPEGSAELYDDWIDNSFDMDDKKKEISELLATNPEVRTIYSQLVPSQTNNLEFWRRYFYKIHQFQLDGARRLAMMKLANQMKEENPDANDWEDDSDNDEEAKVVENVNKEAKDEIVVTQPATAGVQKEDVPTAANVHEHVKSDSEGDEWSVVASNANSDDAHSNDTNDEKQSDPEDPVTPKAVAIKRDSKDSNEEWIDWDNE